MCIFGHGEAKYEGTVEEKNHLFLDLVRYPAFVPLHAFDLSIKLFSHRGALVCRVHHDDHALCTVIVLFFFDLLGFSASEASAFALDRASAGIRIYRKND